MVIKSKARGKEHFEKTKVYSVIKKRCQLYVLAFNLAPVVDMYLCNKSDVCLCNLRLEREERNHPISLAGSCFLSCHLLSCELLICCFTRGGSINPKSLLQCQLSQLSEVYHYLWQYFTGKELANCTLTGRFFFTYSGLLIALPAQKTACIPLTLVLHQI